MKMRSTHHAALCWSLMVENDFFLRDTFTYWFSTNSHPSLQLLKFFIVCPLSEGAPTPEAARSLIPQKLCALTFTQTIGISHVEINFEFILVFPVCSEFSSIVLNSAGWLAGGREGSHLSRRADVIFQTWFISLIYLKRWLVCKLSSHRLTRVHGKEAISSF